MKESLNVNFPVENIKPSRNFKNVKSFIDEVEKNLKEKEDEAPKVKFLNGKFIIDEDDDEKNEKH